MSDVSSGLLKPLSEIAEINPPLPRYVKDDEFITFLGMAEVMEGGGIRNPKKYKYADVKSGFTRFAEHDTLFAKITPCMENGKGTYANNLVNGIGCGSTEFHVLRAKENADPNFIYHVTMSQEFRQKAEMNMTGSAGQRRVPADFFREYNVYIPEFKLQKKIAKILTTIDQLIEKTQALIDKHTAIKQGMMADLFTRGIDLTTGQLRPPVEQAPHLYKETELGWIPKDWDTSLLGDVCRRNGGSVQTGPFGSQLHAEDYKEEGVPIITVEHLGDNKINHSNLPLVGESDYQRLMKYSLKRGDLVFSRVGSIDRCAFVSKEEDGWLFSGRCLRVRVGDTEISPKYLSYLLNTYQCRQWILNHSVGSTMACLNTSILSNCPIVFPERKEQKSIACKLDRISVKVTNLSESMNKLLLLKNGLMQDLLTGKVMVN